MTDFIAMHRLRTPSLFYDRSIIALVALREEEMMEHITDKTIDKLNIVSELLFFCKPGTGSSRDCA